MTSPLIHTAKDIETWATQIDAPAQLPRLVRKLLLATTSVKDIRMSADEHVRLAGADGLAEVEDGNAWCPEGLSLWEITTRNDPGKLLDDLAKRSAEPGPGLDAKKMTYVAVSARTVTQHTRAAFEAKAKQSGTWADVKLLDAENLAMWLEEAPSVSVWFGGLRGVPFDDLMDLETFLTEWSSRVEPRLPATILLIGDSRKGIESQLLRWLDADGQRCFLQASERSEALAFAASVLPKRDTWAARALVAQSARAVRWLARNHKNTPLLVLPDYDEFDPGHLANVHRLIAFTTEKVAPPNEGWTLDNLPPRLLASELETFGYSSERSTRLANESRGHVGALLRLLGRVNLPVWARGIDQAALVAMLLMGAWDPHNTADVTVAGALGNDSAAVERACELLASSNERPVKRELDHWGRPAFQWASPADAWHLLRHTVARKDLEAFGSIVQEVLGSSDPRFELDKEQRATAQMFGNVLPHSKYLRSGVAETLVRLALGDNQQHREFAIGSVRTLLRPQWECWASLSKVLPTLAEAAPLQFIEQAEQFAADQKQVSSLFEQESTWGGAPHTGLLWALETLAWSESLVPFVVDLLARLTSADPGGRLVNRPANSLRNLLSPSMPQSATMVQTRVELLRRLLQQHSDVGWKAAVSILDAVGGGIMTPSARPRFRVSEWPVPIDQPVPPEEFHEQLVATLELAFEFAGATPSRWVDLVQRTRFLSAEDLNRLLADLQRVSQNANFDTVPVWAALRSELQTSRFGKNAELTTWLEQTYQDLTPADPLKAVAWLFEPSAHLPEENPEESYQETAKHLDEQRVRIVQDLWERDVFPSGIRELIDNLEWPNLLGRAIASSSHAEEFEKEWHTAPFHPTFSSGFLLGLAWNYHKEDVPWALGVISTLRGQKREDEAIECILRAVPSGREAWNYVESDTEFRRQYWARIHWIGDKHSADDLLRAIRCLIDVKRPAKALEAASYATETLSGEQALQVLALVRDAVLAGDEFESRSNMDGYHIQQLFKRADEAGDIDKGMMFGLELHFLAFLEDRERQPRALYEALENPELFIQLLEKIYHSETESDLPIPELTEESRTAAKNAHAILMAWRSYPGSNKADHAERMAILADWAHNVIQKGQEIGRYKVTILEIAKVLARPAAGEDGMWPCEAARNLLESGEHPDLEHELALAKRNQRGMVRKALGEGGRQEHRLAGEFREHATRLRRNAPKTGRLLESLAAHYEQKAKHEDERGKAARQEYSEAPRTFPTRTEFTAAASDLYDEFAVASLVLLMPQRDWDLRLQAEPPAHATKIALGWLTGAGGRVDAGWMSPDTLMKTASLSAEVLYLDIDAPVDLQEWTKKVLGYSREIPGQLEGVWAKGKTTNAISEGEINALLLGKGERPSEALLLTRIDHEWRPLAAEDRQEFAFIQCIEHEEGATFIQQGENPIRFHTSEIREIDHKEIARAFSVVASKRARPGVRYLAVSGEQL